MRILSTQPALLLACSVVHAMRDAPAWGVTVTGVTVHLVDEVMHHGSVVVKSALTPRRRGEDAESQKDLALKRFCVSAGFHVSAVLHAHLPTTHGPMFQQELRAIRPRDTDATCWPGFVASNAAPDHRFPPRAPYPLARTARQRPLAPSCSVASRISP